MNRSIFRLLFLDIGEILDKQITIDRADNGWILKHSNKVFIAKDIYEVLNHLSSILGFGGLEEILDIILEKKKDKINEKLKNVRIIKKVLEKHYGKEKST